MTNASDAFFAGGQSLNYGPTSDTRWLGRPRGGQVVTEPREEQQTDINTRAPLFWDDARTRPKMQLVFTVVCDGSGPAAANGWNTDERVDPQDTGYRQVYVKGKDKTEAIKTQLAKNARSGIRVGDYYYECWTGTRPGQNNIGTARTWSALLFPGAPAQTGFFGNEQQQQPPAAPPASPGGQAYQNAQQTYVPPAAQGFPSGPAGPAPHPGPPPQFGQPAPSPQGPTGEFHTQAHGFAPAAPPAQQPVPPVDNPWGQAPAQAQQPAAAPNPWGNA